MLSVTPSFDNGVLHFFGDSANDTIAVAANASGNVTLGGNEILGGVAASLVEEIYVDAGGGNDIVDLTGMVPADFTALWSIFAFGGAGNDTLIGSPFAEVLSAGDGDDILEGGAGNDMLFGGAGDDIYVFDPTGGALGSDTITEAADADSDTLDFSAFTSAITFNLASTSAQAVGGSLTLTLSSASGVENIVGGSGNDLIHGNARDNQIDTGAGNDYLYGYAGNDTLIGGSGNDYYYFSGGSNLGSDTIVEAADVDTDSIFLDSLAASATMDLASTSTQTVAAGLLSLTLSDAAGIEVLRGSAYADTLKGNSRSNIIYGWGGDDWLEGRGGNDYYYYMHDMNHGHDTIKEDVGGGSDQINFLNLDLDDDDGPDGITIDLAEDDPQTVAKVTIGGVETTRVEITLVNPEQFEVVSGTNAYNDTIYGNSAANWLGGNGGDDTIHGRGGNDSLHGGAGNDTYVFDPTSGSLGSDSITEAADLDSDTLDFSAFTSAITFSLASTSAQSVGGSLTLTIANNTTAVENIIGGSGGDTLTGNSRPNRLEGLGGNDTLHGMDGNDILVGGSGSDIVYGEAGDDTFYVGSGGDAFVGGAGSDTYIFEPDVGDANSDTIIESANADTDTLDFSLFTGAYAANMTLNLTQTSSQVVIPGKARIALLVESAFENVIAGTGNDTITGNSRNNVIYGGDGNDIIYGGTGDDDLFGGAGDDNLQGQNGNDFLSGDAGNDSLLGGAGADRIIGGAGADSINGGSGNDRISGIEDGDTITDHEGEGDDQFDSNLSINEYAPVFEPIDNVAVRRTQSHAFRLIADDVETDYENLTFTIEEVTRNGQAFSLAGFTGIQPFQIVQDNIFAFQWTAEDRNADGKADLLDLITEASATYQITVKVEDVPDAQSTVNFDEYTFTLTIDNYNEAPPNLQAWVLLAVPPYQRNVLTTGSGDLSWDWKQYNLAFPAISSDPLEPLIAPDPNAFSIDSQTTFGDVDFVLTGTLPDWATFDPSTAILTIETPTGNTSGNWTFEIAAVDNGNSNDTARVTRRRYFLQSLSFLDHVTNGIVEYIDWWNPRSAVDDHFISPVNETLYGEGYNVFGIPDLTNLVGLDLPGYSSVFETSLTLISPPSHADDFMIEDDGLFQYQPEQDGEGLDGFTYQSSHEEHLEEIGIPNILFHEATSNVADVTLEVGQAVRADIDIDLAYLNPDAVQERSIWHTLRNDDEDELGAVIAVNADDDNGNGIPDNEELLGPISSENDLIPVKLGYWLRDDVEITDLVARLRVSADSKLRIWDSPDKQNEIIPFGLGSSGSGKEWILDDLPERVWVEGFAQAESPQELKLEINGPGSAKFSDRVVPRGASSAAVTDSDAVDFSVIEIDLDVDTNRNGIVEKEDDEADEDAWTSGPGGRGAIILPNADKDNTTTNAPDNWIGGDWDRDGTSEPANNIVDINGDLDDIGPLWFHKFKLDDLPDNMVISLEVTELDNPFSYFWGVPAEQRVRIFLPEVPNGNDLELGVGDDGIIGPGLGNTVEFVKTPGMGQLGYDIFKGDGIVKFGIEGIEFASEVDVIARVTVGGIEIGKDVVRVKVAPFVLSDNTMPVASGGAGEETVFVANLGTANLDLRGVLGDQNQYGASLAAPTFPPDINGQVEAWFQDGMEIGYVKAPYGEMPVILELPRARSGFNGAMSDYIRQQMLRKDLAVNIKINGAPKTDDFGGNLESLSDGSGPGVFFHGDGMSPFQTNFVDAQAVNSSFAVNTDWLWVKHVDEVVSLASNGQAAAVADPELAWGLLLWANSLDPNARMVQNMNGFGATGVAVQAVVNEPVPIGRDFNMNTVMHANNLPSIWSAVENHMNISRSESQPVADAGNTGTAQLSRGGSFSAFLSGKRYYEIRFPTSATAYELWYRDTPEGAWIKDSHNGNVANDEVFPEAKAYVLYHRWSGAAAAGDKFRFEVDPDAKMVGIPVVFYNHNGARAYTTNNVNSLVDGAKIFAGWSFGPEVDYGNGVSSIFDDYIEEAFTNMGYTTIFADVRDYHNGEGSIHCGTNAIREIPSYNWWNF